MIRSCSRLFVLFITLAPFASIEAAVSIGAAEAESRAEACSEARSNSRMRVPNNVSYQNTHSCDCESIDDKMEELWYCEVSTHYTLREQRITSGSNTPSNNGTGANIPRRSIYVSPGFN